MPSLREKRISLPLTPMVTISSRFCPSVRSSLTAVHDSPRSVDRNTLLAAAYMIFGSCGESMIGVSQCQRSGGSPGPGCGRMPIVSPVTRSTRMMLPSCDSL